MFVSDLALDDFRSYRELVVKLPAGTVVFTGLNGQGKTNLVEAIAYLSTFSSHRAHSDRALLRRNMADESDPVAAVIRARVNHGNHARLLELEIVQGKANRARLNRNPVRPREMLGNLRTVMFAPEDLQIMRGDPTDRRRFLDEIIIQLKPDYLQTRRDLDRVLKQRAATLKQLSPYAGADPVFIADSLAAWDEALAQLSARIAAQRMAVVNSMRPVLAKYYERISGGEKQVAITYASKLRSQEHNGGTEVADADALESLQVKDGYFEDDSNVVSALAARYRQMIQAQRQNELRRKINLVGAHRDDMEVTLQGFPVKGYASQGETWSIVLALRLAEKDILSTAGDTPVLILDDVFSELDEQRRQALGELVKGVEQVLVTASVPDDIPQSLGANFFSVTWDSSLGSKVRPGKANILSQADEPAGVIGAD